MKLPGALVDSVSAIAGADIEAFVRAHSHPEAVTSIRLNRLKPLQHPPFEGMLQVPWCADGYYLPQRPSFTFDPLLHAGAYYVQEASSMFLWQALSTIAPQSASVKVLDVCAAPGGKSTLLSSYFPNGLIVANETIKTRAAILVENCVKWGADNFVVSSNDPKDFQSLPSFFDVLVVDAPCSGSGLFRRDERAISEWSESNVKLCCGRQQRILSDAIDALKEGGTLIYSTCSYSPEENEEIADWIVDTLGCESVSVPLEAGWNIVETFAPISGARGYRFFPDKLLGEGFFMAVFRKQHGKSEYIKAKKIDKPSGAMLSKLTEWAAVQHHLLLSIKSGIIAVPHKWEADVAMLMNHLYIKRMGVTLGEFKHDSFIPDHHLALSTIVNGEVRSIAVDLPTAIAFLKKQTIQLPEAQTGFALLTYRDVHLGWIKVLNNRINNYYPTEWRILKD